MPLVVEGGRTRSLRAEDRLLHTCVHGTEWSAVLPIRWAADATMIVRRHGATLDWDHLAREASVRRLGLPLVDALSYVHDAFGVAVPPRALHSLRSIPARPLTRLLHRVRTGRQGSYLSQLNDWVIGWRQHGSQRLDHKVGSFLRYIAIAKGLRHPWQSPFALGRSAVRFGLRLFRAS